MKLLVSASLAALLLSISGAAQQVTTCGPTPLAPPLHRRRGDGCVLDACLSELEASAQAGCTRMASLDCAAYFITTTTPEESTVYETVSFYNTPTSTDSVTQTSTVTKTATITNSRTVTVSRTATQVIQVPAGPSQKKKKKKKRAVATRMPGYASAVCSAEAWTSACFCIGVEATVVEAPTPVTTVTVSSTFTGDAQLETETYDVSYSLTITAVETAVATETAVQTVVQ